MARFVQIYPGMGTACNRGVHRTLPPWEYPRLWGYTPSHPIETLPLTIGYRWLQRQRRNEAHHNKWLGSQSKILYS
ncbi:MAG: hypothetical protein HUU50_16545 [Candidatus Brocadiae bacterium]|nr:hypothetical protein [Candidatus Brocadiia bacterium]